MGDDMLLSFDRWYRYRDILSVCTLVAACRTENREKLQLMKDFARDVLGDNDGDRVIICENVPVEISSTQVRQQLSSGESEYISSEVMEYIKSRGLYRE
jgi:nicotinate-nucleotide adenylyltransferase